MHYVHGNVNALTDITMDNSWEMLICDCKGNMTFGFCSHKFAVCHALGLIDVSKMLEELPSSKKRGRPSKSSVALAKNIPTPEKRLRNLEASSKELKKDNKCLQRENKTLQAQVKKFMKQASQQQASQQQASQPKRQPKRKATEARTQLIPDDGASASSSGSGSNNNSERRREEEDGAVWNDGPEQEEEQQEAVLEGENQDEEQSDASGYDKTLPISERVKLIEDAINNKDQRVLYSNQRVLYSVLMDKQEDVLMAMTMKHLRAFGSTLRSSVPSKYTRKADAVFFLLNLDTDHIMSIMKKAAARQNEACN